MLHKVTNRLLRRVTLVLIAAGLIIPVVVVSVKKLAVLGSSSVEQVFKPQSVTLTIHTIFSDQLHAAIKKFVYQQCGSGTVFSFDREAFYAALKHRFPIVYDMDVSFGSDKVLRLNIVGTTSFCRVNEALVLGNQNCLFACELFDAVCSDTVRLDSTSLTTNGDISCPFALSERSESNGYERNKKRFDVQALPNITIDAQWCGDTLDAHVYDFVHSIPADYWRQYDITYHASDNIVLQPHQSICRCQIIVDEKTFFEKRKFATLSPLFGRLCQRGDITKKMLQSKGTPLVFDFRLKNQIIVKRMHVGKGGKGL